MPPPATTPPRLPTATTLTEVIANFDTVIAWAIQESSGIGYFPPTVYRRATIAIDAAVRDGTSFEHPDVMARFAVIFSQRYFDALNAYLNPRPFERPTNVWLWHFVGLEYDEPIIFQHLLTAVDAHVNLDLGVAASQVAAATCRTCTTTSTWSTPSLPVRFRRSSTRSATSPRT